jgi:hypothetical protein
MGMFDYLKSSYDLGPQFTDVILQTKDIEEGYGGTLSNYWIAPDGYLWVGSYVGCHTLEVYEEGDAKYDPKFKWNNWEWIPTGEKGTYRVHPLTRYIEVYPQTWDGKWEDWPRLRLHFKSGKLQDFEVTTGR